jgi:hypothetical protein
MGKYCASWSKLDGVHAVVLWHAMQSVGMPVPPWAPSYCVWWHARQSFGLDGWVNSRPYPGTA